MKKILPVLMLLVCLDAYTQTGVTANSHYTKVVIAELLSQNEEQAVSMSFLHKEGVYVSRMDGRNYVYLCIYDESETINETAIKQWFIQNGYTVKCYFTDEYVQGKMVELDNKTCE
jgi:hypothetical protein